MTVSLREGLGLKGGGVISLTGAGGKTSLMYSLARELSLSGDTVLTTTTTKIFPPTREQSAELFISSNLDKMIENVTVLLNKSRHLTAAAGLTASGSKLIGFEPNFIAFLADTGIFRWIIIEADGAAGKLLKAPAVHEPVIPDCSNYVVGLVGLKAVGLTLSAENVFRHARVADICEMRTGHRIDCTTLSKILTHPRGIFQYSPENAEKIAFLNMAEAPERRATGREVLHSLARGENTIVSRAVLGNALREPFVLEYHPLRKTGKKL